MVVTFPEFTGLPLISAVAAVREPCRLPVVVSVTTVVISTDRDMSVTIGVVASDDNILSGRGGVSFFIVATRVCMYQSGKSTCIR